MKACEYCGRENGQEATHCYECGTSFTKQPPQWVPATGALHKFILRVEDKLRTPYEPNPLRRNEVLLLLAQRPVLTHEEWHSRSAARCGIPLDFVRWFRDACSDYFDYDLSAALPDDRLVEDLGMWDATYADVDWDILEDYETRFGSKIPNDKLESIRTFGQFLEALWSYAPKGQNPA
jgi:hypothetical protein